jgi:hypothetical protein
MPPATGGGPGAEAGSESPLPTGGHDDERGREASLEASDHRRAVDEARGEENGERGTSDRGAHRFSAVRRGARRTGTGARAGLGFLADRVIDLAPRLPVRDLATLRRQFPDLGPEELADKLVAGAANSSATVGAGVGAAAMLPVPPALPAELATEITAVAAIELKLIAELYEVYGQRPPGGVRQRGAVYLSSWTTERGVDVTRPSTLNVALGGQMKRELRQQIMKRMVRSLPNLVPFMVGAAVGAMMNRRDTRHVAEHIRKDLRRGQVPWHALAAQPPLELPGDTPPELPGGLDG